MEHLRHASDVFTKAAEISRDLIEQAERNGLNTGQGNYCAGLAAYELRLYDDAIEYLRNALGYEESAEIMARLSMCYWRKHDLIEAEAWILKAIESDTKGMISTKITKREIPYLAIYAAILLDRGRVEEAIAAANSAEKVNDRDPTALHVRATAMLLKNDYDKVIQDTNAAREKSADIEISAAEVAELSRLSDLAHKLRDADLTVTPIMTERMINARWPD